MEQIDLVLTSSCVHGDETYAEGHQHTEVPRTPSLSRHFYSIWGTIAVMSVESPRCI